MNPAGRQMLAAWVLLGTAVCRTVAGPFPDEYAGVAGTSSVFLGWINGYVDYVRPDANSGGYAHNDDALDCTVSNAIVGRPADFTLGGTTRHVLSLGNAGSVVVTFEAPIWNRPGPDFAVFENGFTDASDWTGTSREGSTNTFTYAELAFVDVASETSAWARFPVTCLNTELVYAFNNFESNRFASQDSTLLDGVAGKHRIEYGTPFDLSALTNDPAVTNGAVDLNNIRYVRLVDVVGDGSTTDTFAHAVYDPYYDDQRASLTSAVPVSTDGFDLRAVGVIHFAGVSIARTGNTAAISWYAGTGRTYRVQCTTTFGAEWTNLGDAVPGDKAFHTFIDANSTSAFTFYRVAENEQEGP
ncbi:MAG: hypothetical protein V1873_03815 [Verrucomicrobiota bacterium]